MKQILDLVEHIFEMNAQLIKYLNHLPPKVYELHFPIVMKIIEENIANAENLLTELK